MNSIYLNRHMCYYGHGTWTQFRDAHASYHPAGTSTASLGYPRNGRQPVVIHAKFYVNRAGEKCWVDLHNKLREAVKRVSLGQAAGARSVCEAVGGCNMA